MAGCTAHGEFAIVSAILHSVNLQSLLPAFKHECVDDAVVFMLTERHLKKELGVEQLGHRLRIIKAIQQSKILMGSTNITGPTWPSEAVPVLNSAPPTPSGAKIALAVASSVSPSVPKVDAPPAKTQGPVPGEVHPIPITAQQDYPKAAAAAVEVEDEGTDRATPTAKSSISNAAPRTHDLSTVSNRPSTYLPQSAVSTPTAPTPAKPPVQSKVQGHRVFEFKTNLEQSSSDKSKVAAPSKPAVPQPQANTLHKPPIPVAKAHPASSLFGVVVAVVMAKKNNYMVMCPYWVRRKLHTAPSHLYNSTKSLHDFNLVDTGDSTTKCIRVHGPGAESSANKLKHLATRVIEDAIVTGMTADEFKAKADTWETKFEGAAPTKPSQSSPVIPPVVAVVSQPTPVARSKVCASFHKDDLCQQAPTTKTAPELPQQPPFVLSIGNLDETMIEEDILVFFNDVDLAPNPVLLIKDPSGVQTGRALLFLANDKSLKEALAMDGDECYGRRLELKVATDWNLHLPNQFIE